MNRKGSKQEFKVPMRRCIGCMESKPQKEMTRIAFYEGELSIDRKGKEKGRGVYLCSDPACLAKARKSKAFNRNFKTNFDPEVLEKIFAELEGRDE